MEIKDFNPDNYQPRNDTVIILVTKEEQTTASGLVIPKSVDSDFSTSEGKILAIGPGPQDNEGNRLPFMMDELKVGNTIVFSKYAGRILSETSLKKYMILGENEVLALKKH